MVRRGGEENEALGGELAVLGLANVYQYGGGQVTLCACVCSIIIAGWS